MSKTLEFPLLNNSIQIKKSINNKNTSTYTSTSNTNMNNNIDNLTNELKTSNPFKLPLDDKLFSYHQEEKQKKLLKQENNKLSIWEKNKITTMSLSKSKRMNELLYDTNLKLSNELNESNESNTNDLINEKIITNIFQKSKDLMSKKLEKKRILLSTIKLEKEDMVEFITKKREMFLLQMSLDIKNEEIKKLDIKANEKELALKKSEQLLEEDAQRFDIFLKENDRKAHDAMRRAEEETQRKTMKNVEIKILNQKIQSLNSELAKHKETLDDCLRYKDFLDQLTPKEWFDNHLIEYENKKKIIQEENYLIRLQQWEANKKLIIENYKRDIEMKKEQQRKAMRRSRHSGVDNIDLVIDVDDEDLETKLVIPLIPKIEDEIVDVPMEDTPMYFTEPKQLMDIFSALEEQNLFLIQNSQETESSLEELQQLYRKTKLDLDAKTNSLDEQVFDIKSQIVIEDQMIKMLLNKRETTNQNSNNTSTTKFYKTQIEADFVSQSQLQEEKEKLLSNLNLKVQAVYERCGFNASSKPSTLFMLSQLESKLEWYLSKIDKMPIEYVIKQEKEKEKRRRQAKRDEQHAIQEKKQEERNRSAIERALKAPKKRTGRQVMYRSAPIRKETDKLRNEDFESQNDDELKFLS